MIPGGFTRTKGTKTTYIAPTAQRFYEDSCSEPERDIPRGDCYATEKEHNVYVNNDVGIRVSFELNCTLLSQRYRVAIY